MDEFRQKSRPKPIQEETLPDEMVVRRVLEGDRALFELLMRRHNRRVFRTVFAILGSELDAEDVMQQTYVQAYLHLAQFRGDAAFSTWLTRIAVNQAKRLLRGSNRRLQLVSEPAPAEVEPVSDERSPEDRAMNDEVRRILERQLLALPEDYRTVLVLRDIEGLATSEAAEVLEVTEGVVRTRLHRARAMMRERLARLGDEGLGNVLPFAGARCDRVVAAVMAAIEPSNGGKNDNE